MADCIFRYFFPAHAPLVCCPHRHCRSRLDVKLVVRRGGDDAKYLYARLAGEPYVMGVRALARWLLVHPITVFLTMPRILYEAARLAYGKHKRLPVFVKPEPIASTIKTLPPTPWEAHALEWWLEASAAASTSFASAVAAVDALTVVLPQWPLADRQLALPIQALAVAATQLPGPDVPAAATTVRLANYALPVAIVSSKGWAAIATSYAAGGWDAAAVPLDAARALRPWAAADLPPPAPLDPATTVATLTALLMPLVATAGPVLDTTRARAWPRLSRLLDGGDPASSLLLPLGEPWTTYARASTLRTTSWRSPMADVSPESWCMSCVLAVDVAKYGAAARLSAAADRALSVETRSAPTGLLDVLAASAKALLATPLERGQRGSRVLVVGTLADARYVVHEITRAALPGVDAAVAEAPTVRAMLRALRAAAAAVVSYDVVMCTHPQPPAEVAWLRAAFGRTTAVMLPQWVASPADAAAWAVAERLPPPATLGELAQRATALAQHRVASLVDATVFGAITNYVHSPYARVATHNRLLAPLRAMFARGTSSPCTLSPVRRPAGQPSCRTRLRSLPRSGL